MTGRVSVVITARDAEEFVEEAIRSALEQTQAPDRVVVVDDGSCDATAEVAGSLDDRVVVLRRSHEGIGPSRNAGLAATATELVAFLDADDVWLPEKLERQTAELDRDPGLDAVFCLIDEFLDPVDGGGGLRAPRTRQAASLSSNALLRRRVLDLVGPFEAGAIGDWARWWARARALGVREHIVPEVLVRRRIHGRNNSLVRNDDGSTFLAIAREHLHQRRAHGANEPTDRVRSDGA
ncbi:MAG TPA: glycosyltransferase family A protein [Acidimicrobiia bacterium]|nr:glycosyltransferase family A protein [Acidimicrobiia bacterium]